MKRPHAEQAIAWFNNDEMVVLQKTTILGWVPVETPQWYEGVEHFTCHKSHLPAVLELLNDGEAECWAIGSNCGWSNCNLGNPIEWSPEFWYMSDKFESRTKSKK